jgi:Flp pilus assembly protein TadG
MKKRLLDRRGEQSGVIAVITAIAASAMLVAGALAVDLGNTWARRGNLQNQADQAAVFAANYLPAYDDAGKLKVAKAAAYYLVCNKVYGQTKVDPTMPTACPSAPESTDSAFVAYASRLLAEGNVTFPTIDGGTGTYVQVRTPGAKIEFGLGAAAGASGSVQVKTATARVGSPGSVTPMSLSLNCLLSAAMNLPGGIGNALTGILPLNYIAPGPIKIDNVITKWPTMSTSTSITLNAPSITSAIQGINPGQVTWTGAGWGTVNLLGIGPAIRLVFAQGDQTAATVDSLPYTDLTPVSLLSLLGTGIGPIPSAVFNKVGTWRVRVGVKAVGSTNWTYSKTDAEFNVQLPGVTQDLLGCARLLKTPRDLQVGTPGNLDYSLKAGVDHPIVPNPNLVTVNLGSVSNVPTMLNALEDATALVSCNNQLPNIYDTGGVHPTPNCVMPEQGANTYKEFTDGMIGPEELVPANNSKNTAAYTAAGRLVCTSATPCRSDRKFTLPGFPGREINDDRFTDFVKPERVNLLTEAMFFNLSTYLTPGVPVVTPDSALLPDLYKSARFMWVPVISSPVAPNSANYYPVLTYRPIFITQDAPHYLDEVDMVLDIVDAWVKALLGISPDDDHGLLMNASGDTLRALRFMTIEPSALPAPPDNYDGPMTDYLGSGPKVVRLVR